MTYQLPPEIDERVQSQLALGLYSTPAEVLTSALNALEERNEDLASIQRGIVDEQTGRVTPLHQFDAQLRAQFGIPSHE
jgi:predicted transcriptional regulator